jgi:GTP-binding protein
MLVANVDYDDFKGKMAVGRVMNGEISAGETIKYGRPDGEIRNGKIGEIFQFDNVGKVDVKSASAGDIVMLSGIADIAIGDTIMNKDVAVPLEPIDVEEPTVRMSVSVNKSPLAGREGKLVQSRAIRDRLFKELDRNVALKVYETDSADTYEICGRGQLHLTVLIENMRREGFELMIGPPTVIEKFDENNKRLEPYEV